MRRVGIGTASHDEDGMGDACEESRVVTLVLAVGLKLALHTSLLLLVAIAWVLLESCKGISKFQKMFFVICWQHIINIVIYIGI